MEKYIKSLHPLLYIVLLLLISPIYGILNQSTEGAINVALPIDDYIPFLSVFVIPYLLWYPFIYGMLVYYCYRDRKQYYNALGSIIAGKLFCFVIYYFWQTTMPRPVITDSHLFADLIRFVYAVDEPVNCLPSIHVMTTFVIMLIAYSRRSGHKWEFSLVTTIGTLIILSTLFTKQHAVIDAAAGMFVASFFLIAVKAAANAARRMESVSLKKQKEARDADVL